MSHAHPNSRNKGLKFLAFWGPLIVLPLIWILYPKCLSEKNPVLDLCDTRWYDNYFSHIGYRLPVVFVVKLLKSIFPGMTSFQCGTLLSSVGLMGLFGLMRKYFRTWHGRQPSNLQMLAWFAMSPSILLLAAQISTDFLAGIVTLYVLMEVEWERRNQRLQKVPLKRIMIWAFLLLLSWSIKETIIFLWAGYGLVFLAHELKHIGKDIGFVLKLFVFCILFLGVEFLLNAWVYRKDHTFLEAAMTKLNWIIIKPHGGNGAGEVEGATSSTPIHILFFHIWNHVKVYGRMGIAGLLGMLAAAVYARRDVWAQTFISTMIIFSALAFTNRFLMERYWLIAIVIELMLVARLLVDVQQRWKWSRIPVAGLMALAFVISLYNFAYRYNPPLVKRNPTLETTYCCRPELCPNDPFFWPEAQHAEDQVGNP